MRAVLTDMSASHCCNRQVSPQAAPGRRTAGARTYAYAGAVTLLLASAAPCIAWAQVGGGSSGGNPAGQPLTIGVRERTTYDTDAARGSAAAAILRGLHQADIIYSPAVTVDYSSPSARRGLALNASVGYDYHQNNSDLSREHIEASALAHATLGRCAVVGDLGFTRAQSGLEDQTLLVTRNTLQSASVSASETCAASAGLTETVRVQYTSSHNSDATLLDSQTLGTSASIGYSNSSIGTVSGVVNYSKTTYDAGAPQSFLGTPSGFHVVSVGVNVSRPIGARLAGQAGVFYSVSDTDGGATLTPGQETSFNGLTANVGLTYRIGPRLRLQGTYARIFQASQRQGAVYSINNVANLTANYTVSSRISVFLGGNWSRESYRGQDPLVQQIAPNKVDLKTATAGVTVRVGRRSTVSADVHHEESKTDLALFNFKSDRASLTLATSF